MSTCVGTKDAKYKKKTPRHEPFSLSEEARGAAGDTGAGNESTTAPVIHSRCEKGLSHGGPRRRRRRGESYYIGIQFHSTLSRGNFHHRLLIKKKMYYSTLIKINTGRLVGLI